MRNIFNYLALGWLAAKIESYEIRLAKAGFPSKEPAAPFKGMFLRFGVVLEQGMQGEQGKKSHYFSRLLIAHKANF